ncbi:MAG: DASS family sodium-coupled anion symporter [Candidatus Abyssobacteria bacterium SURF_5]|uniref:DASS family sodium-coupled anion symporter n=1 Tax=Abyssobacteria bacterium (strain SURF_5) TaxID=2093360 RepID=A0A3A4N780_ABYX5|nr:MAG: DASS family sodium-coupled anion symporter [Candidatus Abyssubacteria bacterium SURF_5]
MAIEREARPAERKKATGYDKYIDWKIFIIPLALLFGIIYMPPTKGMIDVGTEYSLGSSMVIEHLALQHFNKSGADLEQWQLLTARIQEQSIRNAAMKRSGFLKRDEKWCRSYGIPVDKQNLARAKAFVEALSDDAYAAVMVSAASLRTDGLNYDDLTPAQKKVADKGIWKLKVALGVMVFTVGCFVTACIPLPAVAFFIGIAFTFTGVVSREDVASLYWSDAVWFILGSLMFSAAFVKTGVDRRICLALFNKLAKPSVAAITFVLIAVIAPASSFISDHALAAIFLPIAIILFRGSQKEGHPPDMELAKMLMITVAMACNIGGFGAPSGGARNVIMMTYLNDMFGLDIGYFTWVTYAMPFVVVMMPLTWLVIRWRFKPKTSDLSGAMTYLQQDISRMGKWNRQQIVTLIIFAVMVWLWFTEKEFYQLGIYPVRLGIGVVAIAGGIAYILAGVVNWRDYQEKVDWGVVWLYAGAIIFGKVLDEAGAAFYLARSAVEGLAQLGMSSGLPLIALAGILTGGMTQIMADGPAAAAVGPITLNMAGIVHPGTFVLPFMAMVTACASSFAYCLIIGTPPNAIVYASGYLEPKDYLRVGVILWVVANVVLLLMVSFYWMIRGFGGLPGI